MSNLNIRGYCVDPTNADSSHRSKMLLAFVTVLFCLVIPVVAAGGTDQVTPGEAALERLQADVPGLKVYRDGTRVSRLYGKSFGSGGSALAAAEQFRLEHARALGAEPQDLAPAGADKGGRYVQPVMYDQTTGRYKFSLITYRQVRGDLPVFRSDLRLLVRNDADHPVVWAGSSLRELGDFAVDKGRRGGHSDLAEQAVRGAMPDLTRFTPQTEVIWAGTEDEPATPRLAVQFTGSSGESEAWLFVVDVETGDILYQEDMIVSEDVYGSVLGMATAGTAAEHCEYVVPVLFPEAKVILGDTSVYCDQDGDFTIPYSGPGGDTAYSPVSGRWFDVDNLLGDEEVIGLPVFPDSPVVFIHNWSNILETVRSQTNAYYRANLIRYLVYGTNPDFPGLDRTEFPVNVNSTDYFLCPGNAWYNSADTTLNFCLSGDGHPNTAFSSVIYHEYGHYLVHMGGSLQGQYGEGMSDCISMLATDESGTGFGFLGPCEDPLRDADTAIQYPCTGEIHACGILLSACVWSTRNQLIAGYPDDYLDILSDLTINSILLHEGFKIEPDITIDFLTLDDNDGDLGNGTPHSTEILAGFGAHNMAVFDGQIIWVDAATGSDETGDGSESNPYASIQKGIDESSNFGDTVMVRPGTYGMIDFSGKPILVTSTDGPLFTTITGPNPGQGTVVKCITHEDRTSILEGFTLTSGYRGVYCYRAGPTIRGNVIRDLAQDGISLNCDYLPEFYISAAVINNTIVDCGASGVYNNTLTANIIKNNIITGCAAGLSREMNYGIFPMTHPDNSYNCVYGNTVNYSEVTPGPGSFSQDPELYFNYRLKHTSPCIDAGDPDPEYNDPDSSRNDMGAMPTTLYPVVNVPADQGTIQAAINIVDDFGQVLVAPGTYNELNINFKGKPITVKSTDGPMQTKITSNVWGTIFRFNHGETEESVLEGFKLENCDIGVICNSSGPTIRRNIFKGQQAFNSGAICLWGETWGSDGDSPARIINNTIFECGGSGIVDKSWDPPIIKNNIVYNNDDYGIDWCTGLLKPMYHPLLSYNDVYGNGTDYHNITDSGIGSISLDPRLLPGGSLWPDSPCIDAGDPDSIYNDPDGSRNDMGAVPYQEPQVPPRLPKAGLPSEYALSQNRPNPFNPVTEIAITLPRAADVRLEVFNILGQRVAILVDKRLEAGHHTVTWDAYAMASGVYLYRLTADDFAATRKMVLLK